MLVNLHISNIALIDELDIDFSEGLNILTGETGAGKSIIIGSIGIGLGGRFDKSLLRDETKDGMVELLFNVDEIMVEKLRKLEIEAGDGEVLISRRLAGNRTINRINNMTVTASVLKEVAGLLINLHAQHEQRTLLKPEMHMELLDSSDEKLASIKEEVRKLYNEHKEVVEKLESMQADEAERAKKLDFISYEINEIEQANLKQGEDDDLEIQFKKGSNAREIAEVTQEVYSITGYDDGRSAGNQLSRAVRDIQSLPKLDEDSAQLSEMLSEIDSLLSDFNKQLKDYMSESEFSEEELTEIEARLNLINSLKVKYGRTIDDIKNTLKELKEEQEELLSYDETILKLSGKESELNDKMLSAAAKLTKARHSAADKLCKAISKSMMELNFNRVDFSMHFEELEKCTAGGKDKAVFYISTNIGEDPGPLNEIASGGELSRVLLSIKSAISEKGGTPTLIFDEIDSGISGVTAQKVGKMMKKLSGSHQIIAITHLPQIAAEADTAFVIEKTVDTGRTYTNIRSLTMDERVTEIARLLGGENITDSVISAAREMIGMGK
ncbi:MAG: DNA repair protein RecN [Eubacterium sp.]|nr:DNA repair protein RecN [Eubacterium sp.]